MAHNRDYGKNRSAEDMDQDSMNNTPDRSDTGQKGGQSQRSDTGRREDDFGPETGSSLGETDDMDDSMSDF